MYQSGITLAASDPSTVLETRLDFERNRLQVALLNSGKYNRGMTTFKPEPVLKAASDGTVKQETPDVPVDFTKNSSVLFTLFELLMTIVVAGNIAIVY